MGADDKPVSWTDWCLPSTPGLNVPPVGTPVWVTFLHGMIDHPNYRWGWHLGSSPATSQAPKSRLWHSALPAASFGTGPEIRANIPADPAATVAPRYPLNRVFDTPDGFILELDSTPYTAGGDNPGTGRRARLRHPSGTIILVDGDGSVYTLSEGAQYHRSKGDFVVQLGQGASFKVVYPDGTAMVLGPSGWHVTGTQATVFGRPIVQGGGEI